MSAEGATSSCQSLEHVFLCLPKTLCKLYPLAKISRKNEALIVALHALMLEVGFTPQDVPEDKVGEMLPGEWNNASGVVRINYFHKTCPGRLIHVIYVVMGPCVTTHGKIADTQNVVTFSIKADAYINDAEGFSDPKCIYRNFQKLSQVFKDSFAYAVLADLQSICEVEPTFGLAGLPMDMKFHLLNYLPVKSLVSLSGINKEFHKLANSSFLWKKLFLRDFPEDVPIEADEQQRWKELYIESYRRKLAWKKRSAAWPPLPVPPELNPHFPGAYPPIFPPPYMPFDPRPNIGIPPEIQEAFPHLARRSRENPLLQDILPKNPLHPAFRFL